VTRRGVPQFAVTTSAEGATVVVTVKGELDIASAPAIREALLRLVQDETPDLVLDVNGVTFVDSSGLAVLLMASRRWGDAGKRIVLRNPSRALLRVVDLTGARPAFDVS
jgi:anti-sigma B factor antagonist